MPQVNTTVQMNYASGTLQLAGGGDADVTTEPGRQTAVELSTSNLRVNDTGNAILLDIFYSVREVHADYTFLVWSGTAELPAPVNAISHTLTINDARNYSESWIVEGRHHEWMELNDTGGTVIERGSYRIDGSGADLNNAGIQLLLVIPVSYSVQ